MVKTELSLHELPHLSHVLLEVSSSYQESFEKSANEPKSDEMFKKAGYTSLALSCQLLLLTTMFVLFVDSFSPFLQEYNAKDMASAFLMLGGLLVLLSSRYYSHHPDKT